jgi:hypothetical protein
MPAADAAEAMEGTGITAHNTPSHNQQFSGQVLAIRKLFEKLPTSSGHDGVV